MITLGPLGQYRIVSPPQILKLISFARGLLPCEVTVPGIETWTSLQEHYFADHKGTG